MQIPNLPTDNLYKFLSLSGLIFFLFCIVYPEYLNKQLTTLINENGTNIGILKIKYEQLNKKMKILAKAVKTVENNLKKYKHKKNEEEVFDIEKVKKDLHNKEHRNYLKFLFQYEDKIFPEFKENEACQKQLLELEELNYQFEIISFKLKHKNQISKELLTELKTVYWLSLLGRIIGLFVTVIGFYFWYNKVQKLLDKKIELEINAIYKN